MRDYCNGIVMAASHSEPRPPLAVGLRKLSLAALPTPVRELDVEFASGRRTLLVKYDNLTSSLYGGNKLRKLEYLLQRAIDKRALRVATFGTVASHHALATSIYARNTGLGCTCFLSHQVRSPSALTVLGLLLENEAEVVRFGGNRQARVTTMRRYAQGRRTWVIPMGGSSWLGTTGFVDAGLELADQLAAAGIVPPDRLYIACGTMGSAAGLALGLALAGLDTVVVAVRVSPDSIMNRDAFDRLLRKTAGMLRRLDPGIPRDLHEQTHVELRHEYFGEGYACTTPETDAAIAFAERQLALQLEVTYTGKAMAALIDDAGDPRFEAQRVMFWNTYNSNPLPAIDPCSIDRTRLPDEFLRYVD